MLHYGIAHELYCLLILIYGRHRLKDTINIHLNEIEWEGVDWAGLTRDKGKWRALVNTVLNFRVP
jgi:hypothetical protein